MFFKIICKMEALYIYLEVSSRNGRIDGEMVRISE
jgi:hypothetical protein